MFHPGIPKKAGHYWLKLQNTDKHPVSSKHWQGVYARFCHCHPGQVQGLDKRTQTNLEKGFVVIDGWMALPGNDSELAAQSSNQAATSLALKLANAKVAHLLSLIGACAQNGKTKHYFRLIEYANKLRNK